MSADSGDSRLFQLANAVEVLGGAKAVMDDPKAGVRELRFTAVRLAESLRDLLRIAESRGRRLPVLDELEYWHPGGVPEESSPRS